MNFIDNLKQARKNLGISQGEFAYRLGVVQSAVSNWEKGLRTPKLEHLPLIATVLQTTPTELIK